MGKGAAFVGGVSLLSVGPGGGRGEEGGGVPTS